MNNQKVFGVVVKFGNHRAKLIATHATRATASGKAIEVLNDAMKHHVTMAKASIVEIGDARPVTNFNLHGGKVALEQPHRL